MDRLLERVVREFLRKEGLSTGYLSFLASRSLFVRLVVVTTCMLGRGTQRVWPFSLVGKFLLANALLFEAEVAPQPENVDDGRPDLKFAEAFYDVVVVGSGPGGSVSALRHAQAGKRVLVIEEGPDIPTSSIGHHSVRQAVVQLRDSGFQAIYGRPPVAFAQGRTVGGGSEVNSGLYHRVPDPYRSMLLSAVGASERQWSDLETRVEEKLCVQKAPQSHLKGSQLASRGFVQGSLKLGLTVEEVPRWRTYNPETHQGMKNTYLNSFLEEGGELVSGYRVLRVFERDTEVMVQVQSPNSRILVRCDEVVVSAGSLETVRILKNSGLVRKTIFPFNFHPMVRLLAEYSAPVNDGGHFPPFQSWTADKTTKFGFSVSTFAYLKAFYAALRGVEPRMETLPKLLAYFGSFTLQDSKSFVVVFARRVYCWIFWGPKDRRKTSETENLLRDVLNAGGAQETIGGSGDPSISTVHLFGSIPIGSSKLIDERGKLAGSSRVFVCDSALLPVAPWVNPQGPVMVLCELVTERKLAG